MIDHGDLTLSLLDRIDAAALDQEEKISAIQLLLLYEGAIAKNVTLRLAKVS